MSGDYGVYRITRIRLVNFHNIQDATIDVGGHLFLLGDNGSGKTTILDAVHYVLTGGGNLMEFNSAARMAGSRQEGRRVQGIVMRYNVDTGPMNLSGGVSYAALELRDEEDGLLTIGVGLSAYSMDERATRWGIIISSPLESVPWLTEENGRIRVTQQKEMRDALLSKGAFYSIGAYEKELARRIFTNEEIFAETCRFLSMGKAYREIAAAATDYHQLFKTLLPEPKTDLFDRIIDSLKTLDEATTLLEDMEKKLLYLAALEELVNLVGDQRESIARYGWLLVHFERNGLIGRMRSLDEEREEIGKLLAETGKAIALCRDQQVAMQRRIDDVRSADSAGLVRQEKELKQDILSRTQQLTQLERQSADASSVANGLQNQCAGLRKDLLAHIEQTCQVVAAASMLEPQPATELIAQLKRAAASEHVCDELRSLTIDSLAEKIEERLRELHREQDRQSDHFCILQSERELYVKERDELLRTDAIFPGIAGLSEALAALRESGIDARLLYEQLEWNGEIDASSRSSIEEYIGIDVLALIMVPQKDRAQASAIVFETAPGIKIQRTDEFTGEIPNWIRTGFDLRAAHPDAIVCLAQEMIARKEPGVEIINGKSVLSFRAHRRRLTRENSRWIGQEERKRALEKRVAELDTAIKELDNNCARVKIKIDELSGNIKTAVSMRERMVAAMRSCLSVSETLSRAEQEYSLRIEMAGEAKRRHGESRDECNRLSTRHQALLALIREEGLEDLERRVGLLVDEMTRLDDTYRDDIREEGSLRGKLDILKNDLSSCETREMALAGDLSEREAKVRSMLPLEIADIPHYILSTKKGAMFKNADSIENAIRDAQRKEFTAVGALNEKLRDPVFGALYGFDYNETDNKLADRRDRPIQELTALERAAIDEQRQVINEKTAELFKKIIVNEMVSFFARHISRLEQMVHTINDLLSRRSFGATRYHLELQKEERFAPFIEAVRKFNPFSSGSEEALRQFIDDHREEIINAEVESVPAVLDYRNWYTYHLRMFTANDEGIIIDRRTKSVGSGGEQAVPNYLTILTIAHFLFKGNAVRLCSLLFDEAFYGIDAGRRDQLLGFASDIGLQLLVASPDQDGVRKEVPRSTTVLVVKDVRYDVHLYPYHWDNPPEKQTDLFTDPESEEAVAKFGDELGGAVERSDDHE